MTNSIISIDPGPKHTAILLIDEIDYANTTCHIAARTVTTFEHRSKLYRVFEKYASDLDAIILEDFKLQPSKASAQSYSRFETVKIIERITAQLEALDLTHLLVIQQPGERHSATTITAEHRSALTTGIDRLEHNHLYAAYQHARYFISMSRKRTLTPVVCQVCGWRTNNIMNDCFNCGSKLSKRLLHTS